VPRFLLQPLVENALKFGQAGSSAPLQLQIELQRCGDQLQLQVINSGRMGEPAVAASRGVGYGLDSLRQRLELHYGSRAGFVLHQDGTRVLATVQLPLR
jgi:LytS/YehU family sensor histidine kinase